MKMYKPLKYVNKFPIFIFVALTTIVACAPKKMIKESDKSIHTEQSMEERVTTLINQMTLKEKVSQMRYDAPAIERLGIPEYNWWNECLHGVARAGEATVFPQGIGMGSTWNEDLIFEMGVAVSDEARAKHHKFVSEGKRGIYQGLTFWTPNINIFRDPRWGRGQETYGEDPYLTSRIGVNYIKALQGNDPKYLKVVATAKHYAVHSGPEKTRHEDNYQTTNKDLFETYLPAFKAAVNEAKVHSVMCAYNRYRDEACCGSNLLLQRILRDDWGFGGYVVSDCWAINDFWEPGKHELVKTPAQAAALAVDRGTDLNCGSVYDPNLTEAVLKNLIDESKINTALSRLFIARFKLGMFDPDDQVAWSKIPYDVVASKKHHALSERIARESMVLLKNENNILPLSKNIKSIAVIGPNANSKQVLLGNYHGTPTNYYTPLKAIQDKLPNAQINYALGSHIATGWPVLNPIPSKMLKTGKENGLSAMYYDNKEWKGTPVLTRIDKDIDFIWMPQKPLNDLKKDDFSVRWTGQLVPAESGMYRVGFKASSGAKFYMGGALKFEFSDDHEPKTHYFDMQLEANKAYDIKIDYYNYHTDPQAHLVWSKMDQDLLTPAILAAQKSDVVILCLGLSPDIEGEEMPVELEGFDKGDRSDITLPKTQIELLKKIHQTGKPTIVVLMNGSALAVNWAGDNIPAILEAWYPGEFGGKAIADVLFGDYNPSGKLPVTFYKSVKDLPDFQSYDMKGRTYRYFKGEPLFPFGHGLSYSNFEYSNLIINDKVTIQDAIKVTVAVKNNSRIAGDEVVQLYIDYPNGYANAPTRSLAAFKKVHIPAGQTVNVELTLQPEQYGIVDAAGAKVWLPGLLNITVGGKQPGFKGIANAASTQTIAKVITLVQ